MAKHHRNAPLYSGLLVGVMVLWLNACAKPIIVSEVQPDGSLEILGPEANFAATFESGRWITSGDIGPGTLVVTEKQGQRALLLPPSEAGFTVLHPVDANLLSTPYLGWSWLLEKENSPDNEYFGVSILVGFHTASELKGMPPYQGIPKAVDETPANQMFEVRWAGSALKRGELMTSQDDRSAPFYVARGGRENTGQWWREGLDLAALFTRLWPERDPSKTHIVFIAIKVEDNRLNNPAYFAGMRLFR